LWAGGFGIANYTMINYKTREERSFYPEIIVGFGKDLVMITGKDMKGLTIRNLENEIVYRDAGYDLLAMIKSIWDYRNGGLGFCAIDLPYVYMPVYTRNGGPVAKINYGVLDLLNGKAHATTTYNWISLVGAFE
jgi:hypothetical protein